MAGGALLPLRLRETGVTYKTAWRMFNQIRAMLTENVVLEGKVEADETYMGGYKRGKQYRAGMGKTVVAGAVERGGKVFAYLPKDGRDGYELTENIRARVMPETMIFTDEALQYKRLSRMGQGYLHRRIHHAQKVYVRGDVHTNTIEGFWSLVKGGIRGVYHSVSAKHLQGYLNEYTFRYNHRDDQRPMFRTFCSKVRQDFVAIRRAS